MARLLVVLVPGGLVLLTLWWRWRRRDPLQVSAAWREQFARAEEKQGDAWAGVRWARPYDQFRDGNGRLNRWLAHAQRRRERAA
jgi:hypothetical protein